MKTTPTKISRRHSRKKAFFLLEATIGMALLGLVFMAMYTGLVSTTFSVQLSRENLRATQIMAEKLDTLRLYGWKKVVDDPYYMQGPFKTPVPVYSDDPSKAGNDASARVFDGEIVVENAPITEAYAADLRMVTVRLTWKTGKLNRTRTMSTLISKYGLFRYVY
jgi:hypothetical protein